MTAPAYLLLLEEIHRRLRPRTYLEIGVNEGDSLRAVLPGTRAVAIDPKPRLQEPGDVALFVLTSDEFFARHDLSTAMHGVPPDLVFIDGMHLFEFVLRDLINVARYAARTTTVLLHDCYPISAATATRDRHTYLWTGDVWKIIPCLKECCPDVDVCVVDVAPAGLGIVRGLDAAVSDRLQDRYDEIVDRFVSLEYSTLDDDKPGVLNRIDYDWTLIEAHLPPPFRPVDSHV